MKTFAAKLRSGQQFIGIGLSEQNLWEIRNGKPLVLDLSKIGVGLWMQDEEGKRVFLQPRDSHLLIMAGDTDDDIGSLLNVDLTKVKK